MTRPTRNHIEILTDIDSILKNEKLDSERLLLENEIKSSSTGSEICLRAGSTLLTLRKNKEIEIFIGKEIDEFISYCKHNGLYPRPTK